jgi:hypothetical protein
MKSMKLALAAAIALTGLTVPAAPALAQHHDGDRWHHDNGRHNGRHMRNNRRQRVCVWRWQHHHRVRVCTWRRW